MITSGWVREMALLERERWRIGKPGSFPVSVSPPNSPPGLTDGPARSDDRDWPRDTQEEEPFQHEQIKVKNEAIGSMSRRIRFVTGSQQDK